MSGRSCVEHVFPFRLAFMTANLLAKLFVISDVATFDYLLQLISRRFNRTEIIVISYHALRLDRSDARRTNHHLIDRWTVVLNAAIGEEPDIRHQQSHTVHDLRSDRNEVQRTPVCRRRWIIELATNKMRNARVTAQDQVWHSRDSGRYGARSERQHRNRLSLQARAHRMRD
jgi:hypothetical protein